MVKNKITATLTNYFAPGYTFHVIPRASGVENYNTVFLIHGWGVRAVSMEALGHGLADSGYTVFNYDYPSAKQSIQEHSAAFLELYRETLLKEHITGNIFFVTHSMGGLLLRAAMAKMTEAECRRIEAIVMLGPPNQGSRWATLGNNTLVRSFNASLGDMALAEDAFVNNIPVPPYLPPVGIIAGRYDGKVSFQNTALPESLPFQRITVNSSHPGLRNPKNSLSHILHFFTQQKF